MAKFAALAAIIAHAVGLVVVNIYLFNLGIADFELFRPRFILTGALALTIVTLSTALVAYLRDVWAYCTENQLPYSRCAVRLAPGLVYAGIALWALVHLLHQTVFRAIATYVVAFSVGNALVKLSQPARSYYWYRILPAAVIGLAGGIYLLMLFSFNIYPSIPQQFGGAEPHRGQFLVKPDAKAGVVELGISFANKDASVTEPVLVLFEGNTYYVIQSEDGSIVLRLSKDSIVRARLQTD
jgi:hypothetical protein